MSATLSELASFSNGKKRPAEEGAIPIYGGNGIMGFAPSSNASDCVAIGRVGAYCGSVYYASGQCWISDNAICAKPKGDTPTRFLYYLLQSLNLQHRQIGTSQPLLTQGVLNAIELDNVPSLAGQARIASILGVIDDLITTNRQINDYLEQCLLARFDDMFGSAKDFDGTIADIGDVIGGATPSKKKPEFYCHDGIGWITPRDLSNTSDKFISHGADDITQLGFDSCSVKMLPAGAVLFSSRAPIGYIAIATSDVTTNQGFKSVVPRKEIGTAFVYCFLTRNKDRIADTGSGTTFPEVSGKTMAGIELALPDFDLCAEFEEWATPLLNHQRCLEEENSELGKLRDTLLPKLMSGEIDASEIELPTPPNNHLSAG